MSQSSPRPKPEGERIVKPRPTRTNCDRPVIAFDIVDHIFLTESGETGGLGEFSKLLYNTEPSIIISQNSGELLFTLDELWNFDPAWQYGLTPVSRQIFMPDARRGHRAVEHRLIVNFFGWSHSRFTNRNVPNKYHFALDSTTFSQKPLRTNYVKEYLEFGIEVRKFCVENNLNFRCTQGALARQFLRDSRFFPKPRRKIPLATNEKVRKHLPGNHYEIRGPDNREYTGIYIDQTKAHHFHAFNTNLPDPNSLYCHGRFSHSDKSIEPWRSEPERIQSFLSGFSGLIVGTFQYNPRPCRWIPPYLLNYTGQPVCWFTTERDLLESLHAYPSSIIAAIGSKQYDEGLSNYAKWATELSSGSETNPPSWLKSLLLSTYGTLATTAREFQIGFRTSRRGDPTFLSTGRHSLPVSLHTTSGIHEPSTNNVLYRGLIEAATRTESLMFANYLQSKGHTVLCVYVDGVIVMDKGKELPFIPDPWRVKSVLHHLRFISSNAFISDEMKRIPGGQVRSDALKYRPTMPSKLSHIRYNRDTIRMVRHSSVPSVKLHRPDALATLDRPASLDVGPDSGRE